jgi:hypothetical protein
VAGQVSTLSGYVAISIYFIFFDHNENFIFILKRFHPSILVAGQVHISNWPDSY